MPFPRPPQSERWVEWILLMATVISAVAILAILALLVLFCLPLIESNRLAEVMSWRWRPFDGQFGILPMCAGSLALSLLALGLAFPMATGICTLVQVLANRLLAGFFLAFIRLMTGIPTVVYGFVSVFLLVPLIRDGFAQGTGFSLLTAALTLSLLILPTIMLVFHARLEQIDPLIRLSSEAMGFTPIQQMRHIFLPAASRELGAAAILGFGRAMGDTLISLMVAGNAAQFPDSLFGSMRTLTAHIALVVATDSQSMAYQSVFAAGLALFLLTGAITGLIHGLGQKLAARRHEDHH